MTTQEAIDHFGGVRELAQALNLTTAAVYAWGHYPPVGRQFQLELKTKGKLKAGEFQHRAAANG